ncbi:MAG TPA: glycine cleavage system protein GcvH [Herpetosiphonaceae bacterium]
MAFTPQELSYTKSHEWVRIEGDQVTIGITDYAQVQLGDVVFVELPEVGRKLEVEDTLGTIESVKAASDIFAPIGGEVIEINQALLDEPEYVNTEPYSDGWMVRLRVTDQDIQNAALMDAATYDKYTSELDH